jgi:hypothetical protein
MNSMVMRNLREGIKVKTRSEWDYEDLDCFLIRIGRFGWFYKLVLNKSRQIS